MPSQLSDRARALIQQARIVSFESWQTTHSPAAIAIFQAADDQYRYLTSADLQQLKVFLPQFAAAYLSVEQLQQQVNEIVTQARHQVMLSFPGIMQPGGSLYPAERAESCWRDFWHFLRCITYGIAGQQTHYTSPAGLEAMRLLYQELAVPLNAMNVGLAAIKTASLERLDQPEQCAPYFDHLLLQMSQFNLPQS
jgi:Phycobilisome protein